MTPTYQVTETQLLRLNSGLGAQAAGIAQGINDAAAAYQINTSMRRMRYFVAQTFFETLSYTKWSENLYYTDPARLAGVFPTRFTCNSAACTPTLAYAPDYVANPSKLANLIYANRNGNGDVSSGDGFTFRGRGGLQLTGRMNYQNYSMAQYNDLRVIANPDMVSQPEDAFLSAGWFWVRNNLNPLADADQFTQVTRIINGSTVTVPDRLAVLNRVNTTLQWTA